MFFPQMHAEEYKRRFSQKKNLMKPLFCENLRGIFIANYYFTLPLGRTFLPSRLVRSSPKSSRASSATF